MTSRDALTRATLLSFLAGIVLALAPHPASAEAAAGLIKKASEGLPVHSFEQVTLGQVIPLGASGHLEISYYASCLLETIDGGTVTIGSFSSRVSGGQIATTQDQASCHPQQVATTALKSNLDSQKSAVQTLLGAAQQNLSLANVGPGVGGSLNIAA